jgi:hypothetical protein
MKILDIATCPRLTAPRGSVARRAGLSSARFIFLRSRSVTCTLLNQQASLLQKELELDHGFHRTPLVLGRLKFFQYVVPRAAAIAQCHLANELHSLGCAAEYNRRVRADAQLRIDRKLMQGNLTAVPAPKFPCRRNFGLSSAVFGSYPAFFRCPFGRAGRSAPPARSGPVGRGMQLL